MVKSDTLSYATFDEIKIRISFNKHFARNYLDTSTQRTKTIISTGINNYMELYLTKTPIT